MNSMTRMVMVLLLMVATLWAAPAEGSVAPNKKLYDFSFVDIEFDAAFRSLSIAAGVDILLSPDVKGKLNLKVSKKTWQGKSCPISLMQRRSLKRI
jgi:type IV pilus assembly protein PilQ